ncbi:hypothetical protein GF312_21060 [Candidatus Poribacteria bacterium]|nr:hypothetical protein [Candidatus Poribacteria bacterium]
MKLSLTCAVFLIIFSALIINIAQADVSLYICAPTPDYFVSLSTGQTFNVEILAEADAPGVTMMAFRLSWTPANSAEFVNPTDASPSSLSITGFFPQTTPDSSRVSGIAPDWTTQYSDGDFGLSPEITVFTAPAVNHSEADSLIKATFRKNSNTYPQFDITDASSYQYSGGPSSTTVTVNYYNDMFSKQLEKAEISGRMLSQANQVVVNIAGNDFQAEINGSYWSADIKNATPANSPQPLEIRYFQGNNLLTSFVVMDFIRSTGWYQSSSLSGQKPGDSDGDGSTGISDLLRLGKSYNTTAGSSGYDFRSDYNSDGLINLTDLLILGRNYGQ